MLRAYIDDSGSGGDSTWYVLAGYIGSEQGWSAFDAQWREVLNAPPRVGYFKASEAERLHPKGPWGGITRLQRDAKIDALIEVIARCARRAICVRLRQRHYDEVMKGRVPPSWDDPYYLLSSMAILSAIQVERIDGESDHIDFVFDHDQNHQRNFDLMLPPLAQARSADARFGGAVRHDDKECLPLQAADLLAWQERRFCEPSNEPKRRHFEMGRDCPSKKAELFIIGRPELDKIVQEMQESAARISPLIGRFPDVRTWDQPRDSK